jgi:putative ABC transport system substrate-binding protein
MRRRDFVIGLSLAAAAVPARAQQSAAKPRHVAVFTVPPEIARTSTGNKGRDQALYDRLRALGWVEGENLAIDRYIVEGRGESREAPMRKAVAESPDVIVALDGAEALFVEGITHTIPIVFAAEKTVTYMAAPRGVNMTGVAVERTDSEAGANG